MVRNPLLPVVKATAKRLEQFDRATKRAAKRLGITKKTVPDAILWPPRRVAAAFVWTGMKIQHGLEDLWATITSGN